MAINMMCRNSKCVHYWEDNCIRNINEERIVISELGVCHTFERGESPLYKGQELMDSEQLNKTLEELDVTVRSYNCLKRAGINSVGDLVKMSEDDLCHIRNMGRRCVEEIVKKLKGLGLELRREETEDESKTTPKV